MAKSSRQKEKLLYLQKIMLEKTDENHPLTLAEIKAALAEYDIKAERKALYEDLEILSTFGLDICRTRTNTVRYYVGNRDFQVPELKLLVDAIQSSKFITKKKSLELIGKLEKLVSENEGKQLHREVYVTNRVKTLNEKIYYNVDILHNSITAGKKISFRYFRWELSGDSVPKIVRTPRRNGEPYTVSPLSLCWDDENYYLIAYDSEAKKIKHYRVDKMEKIEILSEDRDESPDFNAADYAKSVFSMFGGTKANVRLLAENNIVGVIADRFGQDVKIRRNDADTFTLDVNVILSPQFYAWVFGLGGKVKILSPDNAIGEFNDIISNFTP